MSERRAEAEVHVGVDEAGQQGGVAEVDDVVPSSSRRGRTASITPSSPTTTTWSTRAAPATKVRRAARITPGRSSPGSR